MQTQIFDNGAAAYDQFSEHSDNVRTSALQGMWGVDDRLSSNPTMKFKRNQNSFVEMMYESGSGPVMENAPIPKGMIEFLEKRFLPHFNLIHSEHVSLSDVAYRCFQYLDYQEPYFFLIDMPISLTQDNYAYTYRHRKSGSTLPPEKLETFQVQMGWKFPHYTHAYKVLTDPRVDQIARGLTVVNPSTGDNINMWDILKNICKTVFGDFEYVYGMVTEWADSYYEDAVYGEKTHDAQHAESLRNASETDLMYWVAVAIGVFTWLKSPHGLKFLIQHHPVYYELLDWNHDTNTPKLVSGSEGWGLVDGWSIYSSIDIERLPGVPPGTCSVSKQHLHCTERVNVRAVMSKCFCGEHRDPLIEEYYEDRSHGRNPLCSEWEKQNPPQMAFISYAAMYNIVNGLDAATKCQRHSCPNTKCSYHAGNNARIRALTDNRTKMLTASR